HRAVEDAGSGQRLHVQVALGPRDPRVQVGPAEGGREREPCGIGLHLEEQERVDDLGKRSREGAKQELRRASRARRRVEERERAEEERDRLVSPVLFDLGFGAPSAFLLEEAEEKLLRRQHAGRARRDAAGQLHRTLEARAVDAILGEPALEIGTRLERTGARLEVTGARGGPFGGPDPSPGVPFPCEDKLLFKSCGGGRSFHALNPLPRRVAETGIPLSPVYSS